MAATACRIRGIIQSTCYLVLVCLLAWSPAGAVLTPLTGKGNFPSTVELVNRWADEDHLDVLVLVEVANADVSFERQERGLVGRLNLEVTLTGADGTVLSAKRPVRTAPLSEEDASSRTLFQNFGVVLKNIPFRSGNFTCTLRDINRIRTGALNQMKRNLAVSSCRTLWFAADRPRPAKGLALEDPLFLAHAPLNSWNPDLAAAGRDTSGWLQDYAHPSRRYGIEDDHLQLFIPVWPPAAGIPPGRIPPDIRVQITNLAMDFVVNDTINIDERGRLALAAGRPASILYSLDVNILPEGPYRLSLAPLGGFGRGVLKNFSVVWELSHLGRGHSQILGEGRMVFSGSDLERFLDASPAVQEKMLDDFWSRLDKNPDDGVNAPYLEFQYRLAYVRQFLGGFGENGPYDERGDVFLLLGPPDEIQSKHMPMNKREQDDAQIKVFRRFAPDREGNWAKGSSREHTSQPRDPYDTEGGVPMPSSLFAQKNLNTRRYSASHTYGFELWKYDNGGRPLFVNRYSQKGMGQRFLFVDRSGTGDYFLESSNLIEGEE